MSSNRRDDNRVPNISGVSSASFSGNIEPAVNPNTHAWQIEEVGTNLYKVSDIDDSTDPAYYGFLSAGGAWYILKQSDSAGSLRYVKGASSYATAWTSRASQSYDYYDIIF